LGAAFECDENKQRENKRKHGVDLCEASAAFFDPLACFRYDPAHSEEEERHRVVGMAGKGGLLFVSYTIRGVAARIISARKASGYEVREYEQR
jgi:uncharacterized DUF497 family protein